METMTEHWTDDRMDDLAQRVDSGFASVDNRFTELHEDNRQLRREMIALRSELRVDNAKLETELRTGGETQASELRSEMGALAQELRGEMKELREELCGEMKGLREELRGEMKELSQDLRAEMHDRFKAIERRFDIVIGAMVSGLIGLVVSNLVG